MKEYQEAATAVPYGLDPAAPSPGLRDRVLAAATGQKAVRPAMLSRIFWSAAAVFLFAMLFGTLFQERTYPFEAEVKATDAAPSVKGKIHWVGRYVKLEIQGLPALPRGKEYQLWQIGPEETPVRAGTFTLDTKGEIHDEDQLKYLIVKGQTFAVTMEPAGGSKKPTMPIFFTAPVN